MHGVCMSFKVEKQQVTERRMQAEQVRGSFESGLLVGGPAARPPPPLPWRLPAIPPCLHHCCRCCSAQLHVHRNVGHQLPALFNLPPVTSLRLACLSAGAAGAAAHPCKQPRRSRLPRSPLTLPVCVHLCYSQELREQLRTLSKQLHRMDERLQFMEDKMGRRTSWLPSW